MSDESNSPDAHITAPQKSNGNKFTEIAEDITKAAVVAGGVRYFIGFAISLFHYGRFGILAVDSASPQYILIGILSILFLVAIAVCFSLAEWFWFELKVWKTIEERYPSFKTIKTLRRLGYIFSIIIFFLIVGNITTRLFHADVLGVKRMSKAHNANPEDLHLHSLLQLPHSLIDLWNTLPVGYILSVAGLFAAVYIVLQIVGARDNKRTHKPTLWSSFGSKPHYFFGLIIIIAIFFIPVYTGLIYANIPASIGGGRASKIVLILKEDKNYMDIRTLLLKDTTKNLTLALPLIKETATDYYLLREPDLPAMDTPKHKWDTASVVIIIPKSSTNGALYIPD